jgi:hypothetical protein
MVRDNLAGRVAALQVTGTHTHCNRYGSASGPVKRWLAAAAIRSRGNRRALGCSVQHPGAGWAGSLIKRQMHTPMC